MGNQQQLEALEKAHARLGVLFSTITHSDTEQISSNATVERLYKTNALRYPGYQRQLACAGFSKRVASGTQGSSPDKRQ